MDVPCSVIDSKVMMIDREMKAVMIADGSVVPYDALVLTTGLQFRAPALDIDNDPYVTADVRIAVVAVLRIPLTGG